MSVKPIDASSTFNAPQITAKGPISEFADKVCRITITIIKTLGRILSFPARYFGSKFWCYPESYHFDPEKTASRQEVRDHLHYIFARASTDNDRYDEITKLNYPLIPPKELTPLSFDGFDLKDQYFLHPETGAKFSVFEGANEIIIGCGGIESTLTVAGISKASQDRITRQKGLSGFKNFMGLIPKIYRQADRFINTIKNNPRFANKKITLAGQCLGGSLASYAALRNNLHAVVINPFPLGAGLQKNIGDAKLKIAHQRVTNFCINYDWASDFPPLTALDRVVSFIGIRTPGNFGRRFSIPSAFPGDLTNTHCRTLSSVKAYLKEKD